MFLRKEGRPFSRRSLTGFLAAILLFLICCPGAVFPVASPAPVRITILHVNDTHGRILPYTDTSLRTERPVGGAAYLARMIEDERAKNPGGTLLLSGGDMFQGTAVSNVFRGIPVIEIMNELKFDAMAIGNHEFDWGREALDNLRKGARFPFLSANIVDRRGKGLPGTRPYIIVDRKGLKIAVIGLTTTEAGFTTKASNVRGLSFPAPEDVLPPLIRDVKARGARTVVVLSHLGLDADRETAAEVSGIDVIVGGHSHTAVKVPVVVGRTIIVQAGCYGLYLGVLNLDIDPASGTVVGCQGELRTVWSGPRDPFDPRIAGLVEKYHARIKDEFAAVIGETAVDLVRNSRGESNVGNLVCDAMRKAAKADIAVQNSGGIRANIPKGKITLEQAYALLPFDNVLVSMDLTGEQILRFLEQSAVMEHGILQVAGLQVKIDLTKPEGRRVVEAKVRGKAIRPEIAYRVVTNDFLAAGGDRFAVFREGNNILYGDDQREAFVEYLRRHSPVSPKVEGRVAFVP